MRLRRARGLMLRFMRRRVPAIIAGVVLIAAAGWIETSPRVNVWWLEGLALVAGATGVAILWTGLAGVTPDWREPDENR